MHPEEKNPHPAQRQYKSRLFAFLFGREENKDWTLSLYNALNGTDHQDPADIAVRVRMININYGRDREILSKCRPLNEYAWFVDRVREHNRPDAEGDSIGIEAAIDRALDEIPDDFVIKQLILGNRTDTSLT